MEIPILFLEDYASGGTIFCIVEWGDFIAKTFCYKANWYIGAVVRTDHWSGIHSFSSFAIDGVFGRTYGHHDGGVAIYDGYSLCFFIEGHFCTEGFSQYTYRNHGSPSAVYVWSAEIVNRTIKHFVVDQVLIGTDGHDNIAACVWIFIAEGVGEGVCIQFAVVGGYNNADINSTSLVAFEVHASSTVLNLWVNLQINSGFFITLANDGSGEFTVNLGDIAIFVDYRNSYSVCFTNNALGRVDANGFVEVVLNNSQFFFNILVGVQIIDLHSDGGTNEGVVSTNVVLGFKPDHAIVRNSFAIDTYIEITIVFNFNLQAVFINILRGNLNMLAKSNLIVDHFDSIVVVSVAVPAVNWTSGHVKNDILNFAEFNSSEVNGDGIVAAVVQSDTYSIITSGKILSIATIFEGVNASVFIPSEVEVTSIYIRTFGPFFNAYSVSMWAASEVVMSSSFISENAFAYSVTAISIGDTNLDGIAEEFALIAINLLSIVFVGTSEHLAAISDLFDVNSVNVTMGNLQVRSSVASNQLNDIRSSIVYFVLKGELTSIVSFNSGITNDGHTCIFWCNSHFYFFSRIGIFGNPSITSYSIFLGVARSYFIVDSNSVVIKICIRSYSLPINTSYFDDTGVNSSLCNINSDRIDYSVSFFCNLAISIWSWGSGVNNCMNAVTITSIWESYIQSILVVNLANDLIDAIAKINHCQIAALSLTKNCIFYNNIVAVFNPYIGVVCIWQSGIMSSCINNVEGEGFFCALSSFCRTNLTVDQKTAAICNSVSVSNGDIKRCTRTQRAQATIALPFSTCRTIKYANFQGLCAILSQLNRYSESFVTASNAIQVIGEPSVIPNSVAGTSIRECACSLRVQRSGNVTDCASIGTAVIISVNPDADEVSTINIKVLIQVNT